MKSAFSPSQASSRPRSHIRTAHRAELLELLERYAPLSRARLVALAAPLMSEMTVRRACDELIAEGILSLQYGRDASSGIKGDLIGFPRINGLTLLELSPLHLCYRLGDTRGNSVIAVERERSGFYPLEDDLNALMGQARAILRSGVCHLPAGTSPQPPVLLIPDPKAPASPPTDDPWPTHPQRLTELVRRELDLEAIAVRTLTEAVAHELTYHPLTHLRDCVLYIRDGDAPYASLLIRLHPEEPESPLIPAPYALHMQIITRDCPLSLSPSARLEGLTSFTKGLLRYLEPGCVVLETPQYPPDLTPFRNALPAKLPLLVSEYGHNTPSLAHRGALRLARRAWCERMHLSTRSTPTR